MSEFMDFVGPRRPASRTVQFAILRAELKRARRIRGNAHKVVVHLEPDIEVAVMNAPLPVQKANEAMEPETPEIVDKANKTLVFPFDLPRKTIEAAHAWAIEKKLTNLTNVLHDLLNNGNGAREEKKHFWILQRAIRENYPGYVFAAILNAGGDPSGFGDSLLKEAFIKTSVSKVRLLLVAGASTDIISDEMLEQAEQHGLDELVDEVRDADKSRPFGMPKVSALLTPLPQ